MRQALVPAVCVLLLACSSVQVGGRGTRNFPGLRTLNLTTVEGDRLNFDEIVGKRVLVISFWATFCKPCKSEMPFLQKMYEAYKDDGLTVVGISLDTPDTEVMVRPFIQRHRYTFPIAVDRQSEATQLLNTKSVLPYLLVFNRDGKLVKQKDGFTVGDQPALEALIAELVAVK